ncbi:MAG: amidohydrolase family protein [Candidatus Hydrogenedentes bacterium]|nr:amidohydrolase family protein [Candidatus Hydrogenedentota bacterium]
MAKKNSLKLFLLVAIGLVALLAAGRGAQYFSGNLDTRSKPAVSAPSPNAARKAADKPASQRPPAPGPSKTSAADLLALRVEKKIINVHEHMQDIENVPMMVASMDTMGIAETVLVGSSWFTITLNEKAGFTRYDENNDELLKIVEAYPGRFEAWPTLSPTDPEKLDKLKALVSRGATGLKLYIGHGYTRRDDGHYMFHTLAIDDPQMYPIYQYCQENYIPICLHVNPFQPGFAQEMVTMLSDFPDLKLIAPHFVMSSIKDSRMREFMDTFPNLYTDISFGHDDFLKPGLIRISKSPKKFRQIFADYEDRIMWGSDLVLTHIDQKDEAWLNERIQAYYNMLSAETYTASFIPNETLRGLSLPKETLEKVLYRNYQDFIAARPKGTKITREIIWENMGVEKLDRTQGQMFPPPPKKKKTE